MTKNTKKQAFEANLIAIEIEIMPSASHICNTKEQGKIYDPLGVALHRLGVIFYKYIIPLGLRETVDQMTKNICIHKQKNICMQPKASHICRNDNRTMPMMPKASYICSTKEQGKIYDPYGVAYHRIGIIFYKYIVPSGLRETVVQMTKNICNHKQKNIRMMPKIPHICRNDNRTMPMMPKASHICSTREQGKIYDPFGVAYHRHGIIFYKYIIPSGLRETVVFPIFQTCNPYL